MQKDVQSKKIRKEFYVDIDMERFMKIGFMKYYQMKELLKRQQEADYIRLL